MRRFYPGYRPHHFGFGGLFIVVGAFILGRVSANHYGPGPNWRHQRCGFDHHSSCQCPNCVNYHQNRKDQEIRSMHLHQQ
ncbi:hypothetical protein FOB58_000110 [Candida parapsilosis]|uniref:Uncharacterized protein n=2 Tax=Candida parapsilosis TaxID=5480 RepID=G8BEG5_CANPC|nr:uncharacterized protein CPAR2_213050 [Candida parapsilosis]KAF6054188.1 hypothetical protein FOB58_000110 [Candida parapsilosis]KAF6056788.1 hypothetical protein FOB59_001300 [Candida parapsilosis]KAF6059723.1 hypothetical protein FOB60_001305 [Candida parapsilosis]KAF6068476.1 hypothetical protein FOB61_001301 [Candida parapsilosis]CAD1809202.1 unnamed protein product [Candida parapsilosis]